MEEALNWQLQVEDAYNKLLKLGWGSILDRDIAPYVQCHHLSGLEAFKWAVAAVESRAFGFKVSFES